ncbi:MAG: hypothetical protein PVF49_08510 [Anaerolineales bacterium]|jgi:hypothetical protein
MSEHRPKPSYYRLLGYLFGGLYGALRGGSGGFNLGLSPWVSIVLFIVVGAIIGATVAERVWRDRSWRRILLYALVGAALDVLLGLFSGKATWTAWSVDALEGAIFGALIGANPELARRGVRVGAILGLVAGLAFSVMAIQNASELILTFGAARVETGPAIFLILTSIMTVSVGAALGAIWTSLTTRDLPGQSDDQ